MEPARILVVEDEAHLAEGIAVNLELSGYEVKVERRGDQALTTATAAPPDLILLDVMLPGLDGFEVCRRLRASGVRTPVLFLTARSEDDDRIRGLELGADDYLGKPFNLRELLLRVQAILRRSRPSPDAPRELRFGDCSLNFATFEARRGQAVTTLSQKECEIMRLLLERQGQVVSRNDILNRVWGIDTYPTHRTVDNFIVRLRRLFEPDPAAPRYIHTLRGVGYKFTPNGAPSP